MRERMLAIVHPSKLDAVRAVCEKWGLPTAVIATLVEGGSLGVRHRGEVVATVPASSLTDDAPEYNRPMQPPPMAAGPAEDPPPVWALLL